MNSLVIIYFIKNFLLFVRYLMRYVWNSVKLICMVLKAISFHYMDSKQNYIRYSKLHRSVADIIGFEVRDCG